MSSVSNSTDIPIMNSFYEVFVHTWLAVILSPLRQPVVCIQSFVSTFAPSFFTIFMYTYVKCKHTCVPMYIHIYIHNWDVPFNVSVLKPVRFYFFLRLSISMLIMGNQIYFYRILYSLELFCKLCGISK